MLERLLKTKRFPSPLIVEGADSDVWLKRIAEYTLCASQNACGDCPSCKMLTKGFHPDYIHLENPKMEELMEKLTSLRTKPFQSKYKVFSLGQFDQANAHVQNALLKTLEEPFDSWVIAIGVNSRFTLLETIRSRCLLYRSSSRPESLELTEAEEKIFKLIETQDELELYIALENTLKNREKSKKTFQKLLEKASRENYPGHWRNIAPFMEESHADLMRNLNPKIVWERIWAHSKKVDSQDRLSA